MNTIVWYDYETFGANPAWDRPAQFASIRTDEDLNEIEAPVELFCRLSDDYLPHPQAVLIIKSIAPSLIKSTMCG